MPIDEVYLDSQIISSNKKKKNLDVLIAAFPKKIIDQYVSLLKKAGLSARVFEIESQSIARALLKNEISPDPLLLIDLGVTKTSLIIFDQNSIRFTSSIPISSQDFTKVISKNLGIGTKEAEKLKIEQGLKIPKGKIFESLIPILTDLSEQIKKYIDYHQSHNKNKLSVPNSGKIKKILLCGGGANLQNIDKFLSSELKIPVELGNPWINIEKKQNKKIPKSSFEKRNKISLKYTTVLGLALRAIEYD
jgi:type IV pilus assembly protein PilM